MTGEQSMWPALRTRMRDWGLDPQRVENVLAAGCPDVEYVGGWIELKHMDFWPAWHNTRVKVELRPEQVAWLTRRWAAGGRCWVLLRIQQDLLLFSGIEARELKSGMTRADMVGTASWRMGAASRANESGWNQLRLILTGSLDAQPDNCRARQLRLRAGRSIIETAKDMGWTTGRVVEAERVDSLDSADLVKNFSRP